VAAHHPILQEAANSLAWAVIAASDAPVLLLDGDMTVLAASASFCFAFEVDPSSAAGRQVFHLGKGEWDVRQLRSLLKVTADWYAHIDAYEMDLVREGRESRRLVLNARKLDYADAQDVRLLLSVTDVTHARMAEKQMSDLLREKAILLQEQQHRVANSLQIIASVILQSAKRVRSEETRTHLYDAHNRVMSVAAVQQQLAASAQGDVKLRVYFTDLCQSIGASMIRDPRQLSLDTSVDDCVVTAQVSVSLGLIATELVINALKHGFPGRRHGRITVGYSSLSPGWTLSVRDNGVGMPTNGAVAKAGLGTSIVEALARQLGADIRVTRGNPGTAVSVTHSAAADVRQSVRGAV
jgi:two-component sensor histidine kinase